MALYTAEGTLVGTYEYDPYGKLISVTKNPAYDDTDGILAKNPFRYRGYYYDRETGWYYLQSRYYDTEVKRFINADSTDLITCEYMNMMQYNLFMYCNGDPVNGVDPSGHAVWEAMLIGAMVAVAFQYGTDVIANINSGAQGLDIFAVRSSGREYLATAVGGAIAAYPELNLILTMAVGALGNTLAAGLKSELNCVEDVALTAASGALGNGVGWIASYGLANIKVNKIKSMPRSMQKAYLNKHVYNNPQANINIDYHAFNSNSIGVNNSIIQRTDPMFKGSVYSTITSTASGTVFRKKR